MTLNFRSCVTIRCHKQMWANNSPTKTKTKPMNFFSSSFSPSLSLSLGLFGFCHRVFYVKFGRVFFVPRYYFGCCSNILSIVKLMHALILFHDKTNNSINHSHWISATNRIESIARLKCSLLITSTFVFFISSPFEMLISLLCHSI